jgi:addiction module RelE/StbE family toxin
MNITFDSAASDDLDHIFIWRSKDSPDAAHEMIARIRTRVAALATEGFAHMGRVGLVEGTRELIVAPFIIVYQVDEAHEEIVIVAVAHGAQDRLLLEQEWNDGIFPIDIDHDEHR